MIRHVLTKRQMALLGVGIGLGLLGAVATLVQPVLVGKTVEAVGAGKPLGALVTVFILAFVADLVLAVGSFVIIGQIGERVVAAMRSTFVERVLRAKLASFHSFPQGDLLTRGVSDTAMARLAFSTSLAQVVTSGFTVVGCLVVMTLIDWQLLLATVAILALASVAGLAVARRIRVLAVQNREDTSEFGNELLRVLSNVSTVKANGQEAAETQRISQVAETARGSGSRVVRASALMMPIMNVGTQLALVVVIAWGMSRTVTGDLSVAELSAFVMYVLFVVSPIIMFFTGIGELQQARAAIDRLDEVIELPAESGGSAALDPAANDSVRFDNVTFSYPSTDRVTLDSITFAIGRTGVTAIVGESGAGKTTIFGLIERFQDPDSGVVRLFGTDVRQLPLAEVRATVGLVEQDAPLMRGSVRSNLTYGAPHASPTQIAQAVELAQLSDVVSQLPNGLDTELGEDGRGLSGGQRQRLAIARTLLSEPDLILLDEATANLDPQAEAALNRSLQSIGKQRPVLVIAHRASTVRAAGDVLLIDAGSVAGRGHHETLYQQNVRYRAIADGELAGSEGDELQAGFETQLTTTGAH